MDLAKYGGNLENIQRANRCAVLGLLLQTDRISRVDLSRRTGLTKATISNIITDFQRIGIARECGSVEAENGRKTTGIQLAMQDVVTVVVRISLDSIRFALCNIHGDISDYLEIPIDRRIMIDGVLSIMYENTGRMLQLCEGKKVLGISIASLGWLFVKDGHMTAWTECFQELARRDIREAMREAFPEYEVIMDHDAKMSALAEWREYTKNQPVQNGVMLNIVCGIGLGGGIVINGELFHGANWTAGEVGHTGINFNSRYALPYVPAYKGAFEEYASPRAALESAKERMRDFPRTQITEETTLEELYALYLQNDELAVASMNQMSGALAYGLTGLVYVLNPDIIVLGDEIIRHERFLSQLRHDLSLLMPKVLFDALEVRISSFQRGGILKGCGIAMTNHYLSTYQMIDFLHQHYDAPLD